MARQWCPCRTRHCLTFSTLLLLFAILAIPNTFQKSTGILAQALSTTEFTQSIYNNNQNQEQSDSYQYQTIPPLQVKRSRIGSIKRNSGSISSSNDINHINYNIDSSSNTNLERREVVQDVIDKPIEGDISDSSMEGTWQNNIPFTFKANVATSSCISGSTETQGPNWNGTFSSNSANGIYPPFQARNCTWTMQAMSNVSTGAGNKDELTPYVVAVNFVTPIQLVCGLDYLTFYDGPDTTSPVLARLCGGIWVNDLPTIYSTGPQLTAVFTSEANSTGSFGFTAAWASVAPCSVCVASGRGTCSNTNMCNCNSQYTGAVCESETTGFKDFTPRSQHSMAYDPVKDMVYITGGTSLNEPYIWDVLTYSFASNKWDRISQNIRGPDPRYGHFSFMYNSDLYIFGGVSDIGSTAEMWKFNGTQWSRINSFNPEKPPVGRTGYSCTLVSSNNSTKLYVFGGLGPGGVISRDLNIYDLNLAMWKKADHQNSVGLSGASAVYHKQTDSIYYFGGMLNQTTRNVITYQYRISQDLWFAFAPRFNPLTSTPLLNGNGISGPDDDGGNDDDDDDGNDDDDNDGDVDGNSDGSPSTITTNNTPQFYPPAMYDPLTAVWAPAGLMGDDSVVIYGGIRPYGLGVDEESQPCFSKSFAIYDLSCQTWTSFDTTNLGAAINGRANHTMVMRPPGAPGGSKTAWTAYIFGGFDGMDRADMLNVTMNVINPTPSTVNNCRDGLCLFDTDKAKDIYLLGTSSDIPRNGTVQDLIKQRPDLTTHVMTPETCPPRTVLALGTPYLGSMVANQEMTFKIYVDSHDLDIQFEIRTLPTSALSFKSLNVWEGFMNMYWRADHRSTMPLGIQPSDGIPPLDYTDGSVITTAGGLNTSELLNRWTKYSGLDGNPTLSAKRENASYIYFPASDPRRFSGYYVFSLANNNPTALSFSVTVSTLNHPTSAEKTPGSPFNMATLGFFTLGFIFAIILLVYLARKVRQLVEDRDASHRAAEMQLLEDEEEELARNGGGLNGGMAMVQTDGSTLLMKPMYRIVVGVQDVDKYIQGLSRNTLRHRNTQAAGYSATNPKNANDKGLPRSASDLIVPPAVRREEHHVEQNKRSRTRSSFIRDISSSSLLTSTVDETEKNTVASVNNSRSEMTSPHIQGIPAIKGDIDSKKEDEHLELNPSTGRLSRVWSMKSLGRRASQRQSQTTSAAISEETEGLTSQKLMEEDERSSHYSGDGYYDSDQEMADLSVLSAHTDLHQIRQDQLEKHQRELEESNEFEPMSRRNPSKVQPLSIEPLPFHAGLVPRTAKNLRRYQKHLARQQQKEEQQFSGSLQDLVPGSPGTGATHAASVRSRSNNNRKSLSLTRLVSKSHPTTSMSSMRRQQPKQIRASRSQGSLREIHRVASRMVMRTNTDSVKSKSLRIARSMSMADSRITGWMRVSPETDLETEIEMKQLAGLKNGSKQQLGELQESSRDSKTSHQEPNSIGSPTSPPPKPKLIKMRGRQEYEPGPLTAMNYLVVFPGDVGSRRVHQQGDFWRSKATHGDAMETSGQEREEDVNNDTLYNTDMRLPPMAIGTIFVPDPVRWWAYKAKQVQDRQKFERQMRRAKRLKEQSMALQSPQPAKLR
ncbi:Multiple epidermal growth factor-like domains protein 8 [Entomortierella beljakovae]|nr:Multiple epidermal growth factor-like domains protein 8 [Entomortierella beljakovae]